MNVLHKLLLLIGLVLATGRPLSLYAEADEVPMATLTTLKGLTGETVYRVMTDADGLTWIATNSGVNAYNGRQLHSFRIQNSQGGFQTVYDLCESQSQYIYAAAEDGLYRLTHGEDHFEHILPEVKHPISLLAVGPTVYIGSRQGLMAYDGDHLKHVDISPSRQGLDNIVRQYAVGDDGLVWFLGRYDLNSYDPQTGKTARYRLDTSDRKLALSQFAAIGNGRFVIGTRTMGLFLYDIRNQQLQRVSGVGHIVMSVQHAADGSVCVATDGSGAYRLEVTDEGLEVREHFHTDGDSRHRLASNGTYSYYRDRNGVNWFGFVRHGLTHTYYSSDLFQVFQTGDFTTDGMNVRTYCRQGDDIVIGTQNGFHYVDAATGSQRYFGPEQLSGGHIVNSIVCYEGLFYIGTFDGGLSVFNPRTQTVGKQTFSPQLEDCTIGDLKTAPDGRLWIGCMNGLFIIDGTQVQQHFTEQNSRIVSGLILSITFDEEGNAWLTGATGCSLYSVRSREIVETNFPKGFFNRQPWMRGAQGHDGLVFMRTGPQTFYTNLQMTDFGELKLPVACIDKWCRQFVDDKQGHYLLASERGVFRLDYSLQEMLHFGDAEGLYGNYINDMGIDAEGRFWVSTSQGLFFTDARRLTLWQQSQHNQVRLQNIRRGSDLIAEAEGYAVNRNHAIRTGWNLTSEVLQMEPLLVDYSKPAGRLYEYRLDGGRWMLVDDGQSIRLSHLTMGRHLLELRLAGVEGSQSMYTIMVLPTTGAVIELLLLVVALVLLWLWWRWRKTTKVLLSERDQIEDALIESEKLRVKSEEFVAALQESGGIESLQKYQKVKIDEEECADIVSRMKDYLEREKVYTNSDLKMKDLADVLHLSAPKLSQVFNLYLGQNYYDFINTYRLQEFKRLISEGEHHRYTITALSERCGFKKSNFFSTFRKVEGTTPVEYLKKQGVKVV